MALLARLRGDADDRAARPARDHRPGGEPRRLIGAEQVDREGLLPVAPRPSSSGSAWITIAAQLTRPSRRPSRRLRLRDRRKRSSRDRPRRARRRTPRRGRSSATARSSASARTSASATLAPSATSRAAVAAPMPPAAPVTTKPLPACRAVGRGARGGKGACAGRVEKSPIASHSRGRRARRVRRRSRSVVTRTTRADGR